MMKRLTYVAGAIAMAFLLEGASCGGGSGPGPVPTPTPPPANQPKYLNLLLRIEGVKLVRPNEPGEFKPFGAVQCCMGTTVNGQEINTLWPLASEAWMDYTKANMFHFRMGPFYGDVDHESEWAGIGGPYAGGPGSDWNPAFWDKVVAMTEHAGKSGANVEVNVIDTWYCKRASSDWGDQQIPWPQADIDACGRQGTPEQEKFIRKVVSTLNDYGNVIWITDNEGGEIRQTKRGWYEWVAQVIRDEEQKGEFKIVRLIGTNNTDFADGPFDYVATHARAALTQPIAGKHTENNERNPEFSKEQEFANYCKAQEAGLNYWFWRAELNQEDTDWLLEKMRNGCGGVAIGCFPPASDDPLWVEPPVGGGDSSTRDALEAGKNAVGERCGTDHNGSIRTLDLVANEVRLRGFCAGRLDDSVFIQTPSGKWHEHHAVAFSTGCWARDPAQLPKNTWTYGSDNPPPPPPPPPSGCPNPQPPPVSEFIVKEHTKGPNWTVVDSTPKVKDSQYCSAIGQPGIYCPIRPEGDPNRAACEAVSTGTVVWTGPGEQVPDNVYQYRVRRGVSGTAKICASNGVCGSVEVTP